MRIIEFYATKGGQGTTVTACAFAVAQSRISERNVHFQPAEEDVEPWVVLGLPSPQVEDVVTGKPWITTELSRFTIGRTIPDDVDLVVRDHIEQSTNLDPQLPATRRYLVTRNCFVALASTLRSPLPRPDGVVLINEPGRALTASDVADCMGAPIVATIDLNPSICRTVDAGLLSQRLPRPLQRALEHLETEISA